MNRPEPLRAIILARVSTKHASQDTSPERQTARLEDLARGRGWRVVDRVIERDSGARVTSRPAVAAALDKILANKADVLLVDHLFRLGRNARELLEVIDTLAACGGSFYDATHAIDTTGPLGRMIFTVYASIGEFEIADRRQKVREGLGRARARGRVLGRPRVLPLEVVQRAAELRMTTNAEGRSPSWAEVALLLQAERRGKYSRGAISTACWKLARGAAA